jgi:hypothetical protein
LINITPAPILTWLKRLHDRVLGVMKMLGRVLVFRGIAAADMAALQTKAQVDPAITHF